MQTRLLVLFVTAWLPAQQKGLSAEQLFDLRVVTAVAPSPDGKVCAFLRTAPREAAERPGPAHVHLHAIASSGGPELTLFAPQRALRELAFRPDGQLITFLDKADGDQHAEVWGIAPEGGEPQRITLTRHGVLGYRWRPDGKALAIVCEEPLPAARLEARKRGFEQRVAGEQDNHLSLWLHEPGSEPKRLTEGVTVFACEWSPDGSRLCAGLAPHNRVDDQYMFTRLWLIDPAAGKREPLVENPGKLGHFRWSPDGKQIAYISAADRNDPHAGMLYVVDTATKKVQALTDGLQLMVHDIAWSKDELMAVQSLGARALFCSVGIGGPPKSSVAYAMDEAFTACALAGDAAFFAASTPQHPAEVFVLRGTRMQRLTTSNPWLADVQLGKQEIVRFAARDELEIEGLLIRPIDAQPGTRYPLAILVHGGPEAHYQHGWNTTYGYPGQVLAARGICAWYPNYRASTGYGVGFAKADHGDVMGREFDDHLDAIAHFDGLGLVDKARVAVVGASYGGYTAAWAATRQTRHFAAAVSGVPFVDIPTKWMTSDIPWEFYHVHYQEKWPHEQRALLHERSPLTFAQECRTPLLLLGGLADPRVHPSQPLMLFNAVRLTTNTPVRLVQYPGEGHGNRMQQYQYDWCLRTVEWLEHYLRKGDHRADAPPPADPDLSAWKR